MILAKFSPLHRFFSMFVSRFFLLVCIQFSIHFLNSKTMMWSRAYYLKVTFQWFLDELHAFGKKIDYDSL